MIADYRCDFRKEKFKIVLDAIRASESVLVISSDWKDFGEIRVSQILDDHGLLEYLHDDWATPRLPTSRADEVKAWLTKHPECEGYVILEDLRKNFEGCGDEMENRIVWTNNRYGLMPQHFGEIIEKINL